MKNCWLIGAGYMAQEYVKVLRHQDVNFTVIGRGVKNIESLKSEWGVPAVSGGLTSFLSANPELPHYAIVAVSCEELYITTMQLIQSGIKNILVEKPAGLDLKEISELNRASQEKGLQLSVAYNRRYYHSVDLLRKYIAEDGGIQSVQFEFTEWIHTIDTNKFPTSVLSRFIIANSSHVIDTVFHLAGAPKVLNSHIMGNTVVWHPSGSSFYGSGITTQDVLFSYSANWGAPGRWAIEVSTGKRRYYLKPLERLAVQDLGSVQVNEIESDYSLDTDFKPGLVKMIEAFFTNDTRFSCSIEEHQRNFAFYDKIAGYTI